MTLPIAILAGGNATRLRPISEVVPKILLEVAGKPFVYHQIELLKHYGISRFIFCIGYLGEQIERELGNGSLLGVTIDYSYDGKSLLGTGGAIVKALPILGDNFFITYGDSYLQCNYPQIERSFFKANKLGLMTIYKNKNRWDQSNVLYKDQRIIMYDKQKTSPGMEYLDYGLSVFNAVTFDKYHQNKPIDLADVFKDLIQQDQLAAFEVNRRFYEIGSLSGLEETNQYLKRKKNN